MQICTRQVISNIADPANDDSFRSSAEMEASFMANMRELSPNEQADFAQFIEWMLQRPKDEPLTFERGKQILEDIRLENIRRRLGGVVGKILTFKKADSKEA